jgi:hypothetical protein
MSQSSKTPSSLDQQQIMQRAFNAEDNSLSVGSFLAGKVGLKVQREVISATIDDFHYKDGSTVLYTIRVTYDDADHTNVNSAERTV